MNRALRDIEDYVRRLTFSYVLQCEGRKHPRLIIYRGEKRRVITLSGSASDHRAELNDKARIRRAWKELTNG